MTEAEIKILIVEDDDLILDLITKALVSSQYSFETCKDGIQALEHIEKTKFDAVITDINMPGKNGIELAKELKEKDSNLPILMISGEDFGSYEKIQEMDAACRYADEVLGKPFSKEDLISNLDYLLKRKN